MKFGLAIVSAIILELLLSPVATPAYSSTPPYCTTEPATLVTHNTARLNANLISMGTAASIENWFQWTTDAYYVSSGGKFDHSTSPHTVLTAIGTYYFDLSGLSPNTTYRFQAISRGDGTDYGSKVQIFTTAGALTTGTATSVAATSATLNGSLNSMGTASSVNVSFQWGLTSSYSSETAPQTMAAPGSFSFNVTGLSPGTFYHYRAKAVGDGTAYGNDMVFITDVSPGDFTIVALPDTQMYSNNYPQIFQSQTQWIVANKDDLNIVFVTHEGDIVDYANVTAQWSNANAAMSVLDGQVPYGVLAGNHDMYPSGNVSGTQMYNTYFPYTRYDGQSWYGGHYGTTNDNNFELFSASGVDFVIIHLQFQYNLPTLQANWVNNVLQAYANRRAIINAHYLLDNNSSFSSIGSQIYNAVKGNPNLFLMLCGHIHGEYQRSDTYNNHTIYTLCADYQNRALGGSGYLRLLEFSPSTNTIHVKTYSPYLYQDETDADSQFDIPYTVGTIGALDHIVISPSNPSVGVGGTQAFTAQGYDASNNPVSRLSYTWSCTNDTAGSINSSTGVFTAGTVPGSYSDVIQAASGGVTGKGSVTVITAGVLDHIVVSPTNPSVGVGGTQAFTAQVYDASNNPVGGLTYTWSCTNATAGSINSSTGVFTAGTVPGSYSDVIHAASGGVTGKGSVTVAAPSTPSSLSVANASGTYRGTVNLSTMLTSGGSGVSGKTVSFTLNGSPAGTATTDSSGNANLSGVSLSGINVGTYIGYIGARFAGDSIYSASSGTGNLTVSQASSTTSVANKIAVYSAGAQTVKMTATVTSTGGTVNTGRVTFTVTDGNNIVGSPVTSGTVSSGNASASYTLPGGTGAGSYTITGVYSGGSGYAASTGSGTLTVSQASPSTTLVSSSNPSIFGQLVTFTATVTGSRGTPTGTVQFRDNGTNLGAPVNLDSSGRAIYATSALSVGGHTITTVYSGDCNFAASTGILKQTVGRASTETVLTSSSNPSTYGQSVTFMASVSAVAPGAGTPSGTVTFKDGNKVLGTGNLVGGVATLTISFLSSGTHSIKAACGGSSAFKSSASAVLSQVVT